MGKIALPDLVKLVIGMLAADRDLLAHAAEELAALYGPVDYASPVLPFEFTDYYTQEMGTGLGRQFVSFRDLISPEDLPRIKLQTNALEGRWVREGRRQVNLDPGYLCAGKVVLATTKDQQHRLYLGHGIFGEVTLRYRQGAYAPWEWTYPDYRSPEYLAIFAAIRDLYMAALRSQRLSEPAAGPAARPAPAPR
jgi:hypothetical protein